MDCLHAGKGSQRQPTGGGRMQHRCHVGVGCRGDAGAGGRGRGQATAHLGSAASCCLSPGLHRSHAGAHENVEKDEQRLQQGGAPVAAALARVEAAADAAAPTAHGWARGGCRRHDATHTGSGRQQRGKGLTPRPEGAPAGAAPPPPPRPTAPLCLAPLQGQQGLLGAGFEGGPS